jgi:hypothetical protein
MEDISTTLAKWVSSNVPNPKGSLHQSHLPDSIFKSIHSYEDLCIFIRFLADNMDTAYYEFEHYEARELVSALGKAAADNELIIYLETKIGKVSDFGKIAFILMISVESS